MMVSLWRQLIREYDEVKPKIKAGTVRVHDMNDRQQAGLWLVVAGERALEAFWDGGTGMSAKWPKTEGLLKQALKDGPGPVPKL